MFVRKRRSDDFSIQMWPPRMQLRASKRKEILLVKRVRMQSASQK
jgi:hypothetical protein